MAAHAHIFTPTRSTNCQGYASRPGRQCAKYAINNTRYCDFHGSQVNACRAFARGGWRCTADLDDDGRGFFCVHHCDWATPSERVCQGRVNGEPCFRRVTYDGYDYCMPQHDNRVAYYDTDQLRLDYLQPLDQPDGVDRYDPRRMLQQDHHIDHICELQIPASVLSYVPFKDKHEKDLVVNFAKFDVLNEVFNLCRTQKMTNLSKGSGTTKFLRDATVHSMRAFGMADERALEEIRDGSIVMTFTDRLREEGLHRKSTRSIRREMKKAIKIVVYSFADEGDTPVFNDVARVTLKMAHAMDISTNVRLD